MSEVAKRELRVETVVAATPEQVWSVLSDLDRMKELSPELLAMIPLKRGGVRVGQWYLGINRRGRIAWPTRSVVAQLDAPRTIAWDVPTNGSTWIYELTAVPEGTRVVERRPVPRATPMNTVSNAFARIALHGPEAHADALEAGMAQTLSRLKAAVEGSAAR